MNIALTEGALIRFDYVNWQGEKSTREATVYDFILGSNEWHPEKQILLHAFDTKKQATRYFAVKDMSNIEVLEVGN